MAHWSDSGGVVRVFGVNALAVVPFLIWLLKVNSVMLLSFAVLNFIVFIIVENVLKLRINQLGSFLRYNMLGTVRTPKYKSNDFN